MRKNYCLLPGSLKSKFTLVALTSAITFGLSTPTVFAWDRAPIKSYEIEQRVFEFCHRSDGLIKTGNYPQALDLLRQAAAYDPTSYSSYVHDNMAECYREQKQFPQSIKECEAALRFEPNYSAAYYGLSLAYYDSEQFDLASQYLRKLLQTTSDRQFIQRGKDLLAQIETYGKCKQAYKEMDAGRLDNARRLLMEAVKHDPSPVSGNAHSNLAYVLRQTGNPEQAIVEGKKSLQFSPDSKNTMYSLAISCQDIGHYGEAIGWLQKYLSLETDSAQRKRAQELIADLNADKDKLNDASNNLPDYLEHMVGGDRLRRWPQKSLPIKVHINDGKNVRGYRSHYPSYITRAMDTWCNASGNKLSYKLVSKSSGADIDVFWIDVPVVFEEKGRKRTKQGVAHTDYDSDDNVTHVKVDIDCMHGFEPNKELESSEAATVCMHEIGHSLGLDHSANYSDVMYFGASAKQRGVPTSRDRKTIARLYEKYPVSSLAPKPPDKTPEPVVFLPPPAFAPPKPADEDELTPPMFLPPPLVDDSEKLSPPPFFKPPPIDDSSDAPPPPTFTPPPVNQGASTKRPTIPRKNEPAAKKTPVKKAPAKKNDDVPFFQPPPIN